MIKTLTLILLLNLWVHQAPAQVVDFCPCGVNNTVYRAQDRVGQEIISDEFFFNASGLLKFLARFGLESPNIYDWNQTGAVDVGDLTLMLAGFGQQGPSFDQCDVLIDFPASHGWVGSYQGTFAIIHPTVIDESAFDQNACPLNTYWVEIVYHDHILRLWLH